MDVRCRHGRKPFIWVLGDIVFDNFVKVKSGSDGEGEEKSRGCKDGVEADDGGSGNGHG